MEELVLLGFRLEKTLKEELENNYENELTFADNITDFIDYLKNKKLTASVIAVVTKATASGNQNEVNQRFLLCSL